MSNVVIYGYLLVPAQIHCQIDDQMTMLIPMAFGDMSKVGWCRGHSDGVWSIGDTVGQSDANPSLHNKPKHSILCGLETQLRLLLKINHIFLFFKLHSKMVYHNIILCLLSGICSENLHFDMSSNFFFHDRRKTNWPEPDLVNDEQSTTAQNHPDVCGPRLGPNLF